MSKVTRPQQLSFKIKFQNLLSVIKLYHHPGQCYGNRRLLLCIVLTLTLPTHLADITVVWVQDHNVKISSLSFKFFISH